MKRTTLSLVVAVAVLALVAGLAAVTRPDDAGSTESKAPPAARMPVQRTTLACPAPTSSDFGDTRYTAVAVPPAPRAGDQAPPPEAGADDEADPDGSAALRPALNAAGEEQTDDADTDKGDDKDDDTDGTDDTGGSDGTDGTEDTDGNSDKQTDKRKPKPGPGADTVLTLDKPHSVRTATTEDTDAPALVSTATGPLAPGYTVQQTTEISLAEGRGLLGTSCTAPNADFWFVGTSTDEDRQDYVHLTNPDATPAVVDLELFGSRGQVETVVGDGDGVNVPAGATVPVRLSTLTDQEQANLALHVVARSGRVSAALQAVDVERGSDWLAPSAAPTDSLVLPGLPKDTEAARLVVFAPGDDADLKVQLATPTGTVVPAGTETVHVKGGMTASVELPKITRGEPGSLLLTPNEAGRAANVVAAIEVVRGEDDEQEIAFVAATPRITEQATVAGNDRTGTTLFLTAPSSTATVTLTAVGTGAGEPVTRTVKVPARTTLAIAPPKPAGKGVFAVTVTPDSGGPVHAARMLTRANDEDIAMFTVQPMPDDRATVLVPESVADIAVLGR